MRLVPRGPWTANRAANLALALAIVILSVLALLHWFDLTLYADIMAGYAGVKLTELAIDEVVTRRRIKRQIDVLERIHEHDQAN